MEQQYYNLVFIKHENSNTNYLFQAPLNIRLKAGEKVFVDTIMGENMGVTVTESFIVDNFTTRQIAEGTGAYYPIKNVIGWAEKQDGYKCIDFGLASFPF